MSIRAIICRIVGHAWRPYSENVKECSRCGAASFVFDPPLILREEGSELQTRPMTSGATTTVNLAALTPNTPTKGRE